MLKSLKEVETPAARLFLASRDRLLLYYTQADGNLITLLRLDAAAAALLASWGSRILP